MLRVSLLALISLIFLGCGNNDATSVKVNNTTDAGAYVVFDSTGGDIPYPNNILFAGSTDGTLNIPYNETDADAAVKFALNALDGFSTTSPISIGFTGEINSTTLATGLKVYKASTTVISGVPFVISIDANLTFGLDYIATTSGNKIVVLPLKPLDANQSYIVLLTKTITDNSAKPIAPDIASELLLSTTALIDGTGNHTSLSDADATTFEGIRQATQQMITLALGQDSSLTRANIVSAWSFKTQSIGNFFTAVKDANLSGTLTVGSAGINTSTVGGFGKADIWVGALSNLPYYLGTPSTSNPTAPLTSSFIDTNGSAIFTGMPHLDSNKIVPILMTKPNASSTAVANGATAPWPIVIFQHGITQNRTNVLAVADALADAGYATISMDLPLHGLDNNSTGLMTNYERTFDVDYVNNTTGAAGPDGVIDTSGTHYINLASLLTSRDNIRQSASDLLALKNAISGLNDINNSRIAFVGHSLGTIASFGFLSQNTMESVTLAMPGGGIAELLNNSAAYGPVIEAGLASKGVIKGTSAYSSFMLATQTILDDADPINYTSNVASKQSNKIFAIEVVGTDSSNSDQVIPNSVATAPLAGTEPLVVYMGTTNLTASSAPAKTARYIAGHHSSILRPNAVSGETPTATEIAVTTDMQTKMATFVASKGTLIPLGDSSLLKP